MITAILQYLPKHPRHAVRTDSFSKFQSVCGMIEQESYLAGHAACHAVMNGMSRTVAADADISDRESVARGLDLLFAAGPWGCLVIPGLVDAQMQAEVVEICRKYLDRFDFCVILDAPRTSDVDELVSRQKRAPRFVSYAWPWVSTVTPGRRSAEVIPASCLVPPLSLGCTKTLRGVHDISIGLSDVEALREAGVQVMHEVIENRRHLVGLAGPGQKVSSDPFMSGVSAMMNDGMPQSVIAIAGECPDMAVENMIRTTLEAQSAALIRQYGKNDISLWGALTRMSISVLNGFRDRGLIKDFRVRCDSETAEWGTPESPVVEVILTYPQRVKSATFNVI